MSPIGFIFYLRKKMIDRLHFDRKPNGRREPNPCNLENICNHWNVKKRNYRLLCLPFAFMKPTFLACCKNIVPVFVSNVNVINDTPQLLCDEILDLQSVMFHAALNSHVRWVLNLLFFFSFDRLKILTWMRNFYVTSFSISAILFLT